MKLSEVQLLKLRFRRISGRRIGTKVPPGPDENEFGALVAVRPSVNGSISSNTISAPGVFSGVDAEASPPKATRRSEVSTPFQARAASRMALSTEGS